MPNSYRDVVVRKPWGFEYLIYESTDVALWLLHIEAGKGTSLHCHPMKTTGLILLEGEAELRFIADSKRIKGPNKQMIRRGLFHSTKAVSPNGIFVLEIETPNDKHDLVRLTDDYGRSHDGYETHNEWLLRDKSHIWIEELDVSETQEYRINETTILVSRLNSLREINDLPDDEIVMFLKGGIGKAIDGRQHLATVPGDIGIASVIKKVAKEMEYCSPETMILRVGTYESV
jgi:hypothetical protein